MPSPRPEALALGELYRLALPYAPRRGPAGERLGKGTGSSLEFQDRRNYAPGDDVRHLDWRALARTDALLVRQYREEILPRIELLLDGSRSMAVDEAKASLAVDLAGLIVSVARREGFTTSLLLLVDRPERLEQHLFRSLGVAFEATLPLVRCVREAVGLLRPGSLRVFVSDFLSPHVPEELVRTLARGAGGLALLQTVAESDLEPPRETALRLFDSESEEELDLVIDDRIRGRYLARLDRLIDGLRVECLRHGATFAQLRAGTPLEEHCRETLMREGFLAPA